MKKIYAFLTAVLAASGLYAQQIDSLVISPANPTSATPVTIYPYLTFSYGTCDYGGSVGSVNGSQVDISSYHCMGMLSVICNDIDTVSLGLLAPGTYIARCILSGGYGIPNCSPAFLPFDTLQVSFTVTLPTDVPDRDFGRFTVSPNPASGGNITIERPSAGEQDVMVLYTADGRLLQRTMLTRQKESISLSVAPGLYFVSIERNGTTAAMQKLIVTH